MRVGKRLNRATWAVAILFGAIVGSALFVRISQDPRPRPPIAHVAQLTQAGGEVPAAATPLLHVEKRSWIPAALQPTPGYQPDSNSPKARRVQTWDPSSPTIPSRRLSSI